MVQCVESEFWLHCECPPILFTARSYWRYRTVSPTEEDRWGLFLMNLIRLEKKGVIRKKELTAAGALEYMTATFSYFGGKHQHTFNAQNKAYSTS
jgi:hypothetical protein